MHRWQYEGVVSLEGLGWIRCPLTSFAVAERVRKVGGPHAVPVFEQACGRIWWEIPPEHRQEHRQEKPAEEG